jgi:phosphate transport system protein
MSPPTRIAADVSTFRWYAECLVKRETRHQPSDLVSYTVHVPFIREPPGFTNSLYGPLMRDQYQQQLDAVLTELVTMTGGVRDALKQEDSFDILARQSPVAGDLRTLVASLRMVTDLERMGDLSVHVAKVARLRYPETAVPDELRETITSMADTADEMIASAADIVANRDVDAALELEQADDRMDTLRTSMFRTLLSEHWDAGVEPAVDMALLGRYYERIGDHAVSMARRMVYLVTGQHPASV